MSILASDIDLMAAFNHEVMEIGVRAESDEGIADLMMTMRELDLVRTMTAWKATWRPNVCFHCEQPFGSEDKSWFWAGAGSQLHMHPACLIDWLPRVIADAERIQKEMA